MRVIGHIDSDKDARTFGDFLYVQGIENQAERDGNRWAIWIHSDDQIAAATKLLEEFRAQPNDPRFLAGSPAEKLRQQAKAEDVAYRKRVVQGKNILPGLSGYGFGIVTYALIAACVGVFILSNMGRDLERVSGLFITWKGGLQEIRHGEIWRFVTPILIHFPTSSILIAHILFNMLWLRDLGGLFEARLGSLYFAVFVVVVAAVSNSAEYFIAHHAGIGGMSGVNYALIGYCWIRGRFDPGAGVHLDQQSLIWALVWFAACFTGWLGPIANYAHAGGLALGMAWAFVDSKRK